jgi:hypothetical protein
MSHQELKLHVQKAEGSKQLLSGHTVASAVLHTVVDGMQGRSPVRKDIDELCTIMSELEKGLNPQQGRCLCCAPSILSILFLFAVSVRKGCVMSMGL